MAMRRFSDHLINRNHRVLYLSLEQTQHFERWTDLLDALVQFYDVKKVGIQKTDEFRLEQQIEQAAKDLESKVGVTLYRANSEHFLLSDKDLTRHFEPGRHKRMEFFYRDMRRQHQVLMSDSGQPEGGNGIMMLKIDRSLSPLIFRSFPNRLYFTMT